MGQGLVGVRTAAGSSAPCEAEAWAGACPSGRGRGHAILTLVHWLQCSVPEGGALGTWNLSSHHHLQCWLVQAVAGDRLNEVE